MCSRRVTLKLSLQQLALRCCSSGWSSKPMRSAASVAAWAMQECRKRHVRATEHRSSALRWPRMLSASGIGSSARGRRVTSSSGTGGVVHRPMAVSAFSTVVSSTCFSPAESVEGEAASRR